MTQKHGTVTSAGKMQDTVTVTVHAQVRHPLYKKSYRVSKKFLADTKGFEDIGVGDDVIIEECRPLSKRKHFRLKEVVKRAPRVSEMADSAATEAALGRAPVASSPSSLSSKSSLSAK